MSLKSQKSLHEECSEIIERSYSVKTASNESLSCSDDEDYLAVELLHKLTPPVLAKLRPRFHGGGKPNDIDRRVEAVMRAAAAEEGIEFAATAPQATQLRERWIDEQGLVTALDHIFGNHKYSTHAHQLFQLLDPFHTGRATWSKLIDKLVQHGARHTRSRQEQWEEAKITRIKKFPHCKRETVVKLVPIQHAGTFCFLAVSRGGSAGVYDGELRLLASYQVFQHRGGNSGRVKNCWITDAVYMSDVQVLVYGSSDRRLALFSARTPHHAPRETLCRLPAVPACLAYTPSDVTGESELAFGTERGDIFRIRFLQPRISLFYGNATDNTQDYVWSDLRTPAHASYTQVLSDRGVYARAVRRVLYVKDGEYLLSCSNDDLASITVRPLRVPAGSYVYSAPRGVSSFHCVPGSGIISGASADRVLLWRAPPPAPPAVLRARTRLVDVAVHCPMRVVLAAAVDAILYIWDLDEEVLLQTLKLKFPFLGVLGKRLEFGAYSIYPGPPEAPPLTSTSPPQCVSGAASPTPEDSENHAHWSSRQVEDDPEYLRFMPSTLLISCCGHVCVVRLRSGQGGAARGVRGGSARGGQGRLLPPPPHALPARAPEAWGQQWDLPPPRSRRSSTPRSPPPAPLPAPLPAPPATPLVAHPGTPREDTTTLESTEHDDTDLDSLLQKAGLERILEKDFVLMQGLKHDLNKKLADMRMNMKTQLLCARAPHLSLSLAPQLSLSLATAAAPPGVDLIAKHRHVVSLFPAGSAGATPATSVRGSPRQALS